MAEQSRKERNRKKQRIWAAHIEGWKSSNLSQVEYCRQKDLSRPQFTYWKCKLRKKADPVSFVPVLGTSFRSQIHRNHSAPLKLIIDNRYQIEIGEGFSPDTLSTLIRTLGGL
jgi:hypothetical protein